MSQSYIDTKLFIAKFVSPSTENVAGYKALTWVEIVGIKSLPGVGDTHETISVDKLSPGRREHIIGIRDGGSGEVALVSEDGDAGQKAIAAVNGSNTQSSFKIEYPLPSKTKKYFGAKVASLQDIPPTPSSEKGQTFSLLINTGITTDDGSS